MYSDDIDYARKRLVSTVVRTPTGNPFYIFQIEPSDGDLRCYGHDYYIGRDVDYPLSQVNLEPLPLGFVNLSADMAFLCRKPMRRDWRQGLSANNLVVYGNLSPRDFPYKLLNQPVLQQYPSWSVAVQKMQTTKKNSMAFSRDFGFSKHKDGISLIFRKHIVGTVADNTPRLLPDKFFLQQHLDEVMGI